MRLLLIAIGRLKQGPERELAERYRERFDDIGRKLGFRGLEICELAESRARDANTRIAEEAAAISAAIPPKSVLVALDERGDNLDSGTFARHLGRWRDDQIANTIFIIGGADGLSPELRRKAQVRMAFGSATWPHQMVRVMLLEQVYRAATILAGHPITAHEAQARSRKGTTGLMHPARNIPQPDGTVRRDALNLARLSAIFVSASIVSTSLVSTSPPASAQTTGPTPQAAASPEAIKQREQELEATRAQQKNSAETQAQLKAEIAALGQDRSKLNAQLIDVAAQVRTVETRIGDAEARLRPLDAREQEIRGSLDSRRAEVVEVLAALQRAGRRTPPALLVRPEDALQSLRTAILLGAVVPELRARAEVLTKDLSELVALRKAIGTERDRMAADRDRLRDDQTRLAALVDERQRKQSGIEKDLETEGARAIALSRQVDSLQGLISKMEQDVKSAAKAAATATLQGAPNTADGKPNLGGLKNPSRMSPAIAFASAKGLLALPVNGVKIRDFGGSDGVGGAEKGISLATRAGAQVTTPCDGWVVYAGPFRSYGQLLILNAGGGYHVLIAGMGRISVNIGQFVLTGEPVATMGTTSQVASILATNASQPVLYIEFRKDGTPIDPGPWWAANEGEKVRG